VAAGAEAKLAQFEAQHDEYSAIMLKDLPIALPKHLPTPARAHKRELGYAPDSSWGEQLIAEDYRRVYGRRRAILLPRHTGKARLVRAARSAENAGIH